MQSEFNIFGAGSGSQAVFNSGTTITVVNILENPLGAAFGTVPCLIGGNTAETNNLNLDSCARASVTETKSQPFYSPSSETGNVTGITFTESN